MKFRLNLVAAKCIICIYTWAIQDLFEQFIKINLTLKSSRKFTVNCIMEKYVCRIDQ